MSGGNEPVRVGLLIDYVEGTGAPGTRMRFGRFIRHGWVGSEFLVARRVLDEASAIVMHGTINGLVEAYQPTEGEAAMGVYS